MSPNRMRVILALLLILAIVSRWDDRLALLGAILVIYAGTRNELWP